MPLPTRAELKAQRQAGATPVEIEQNRRVLYDTAVEDAHAALTEALDAVAAVEAAGDLATAQAAVSGLSATLGGAQTGIEGVRPDLQAA